jgi:two-component system, cell cycle response regulator
VQPPALLERTRNQPLLAIADAEDNARLMRGLEIGVNDYLIRPVDQNELLARVRTQVKKKRYAEKLRDNVQMSIEAAITDALTGLHNRRYMEIHLGTLVEQAGARSRPLSVLVLDIDFFKAINDSYGHSAGDDVLKEFSRRLKKAVRGIDLACRFGGEEFVVVMPDTSIAMATVVAERLRKRIAGEPFRISQNTRAVQATISIGIAAMRSIEDRPSDIIRRADEALYRAKRQGRNRVVADAA